MPSLPRTAALALILLSASAPRLWAENPDVLWHIVHQRCVPNVAALHTPLPCTRVDLARGYAVLKDKDGATQFLVIPTARVTGIEDPVLLAPFARAYWQDAWDARDDVVAMADRPLEPDELSLAVNSIDGRSQNQLHIHIDCIAPFVRSALLAHQRDIGAHWGKLPDKLAGHTYWAMRVSALNRPGADPFKLLAKGLPGARADMGKESLFVTSAGAPARAFVLLATHADPAEGNYGAAEELQDHDCALAHTQGAAR